MFVLHTCPDQAAGGAAGSGYVFLGALERLEKMGILPDYLVGCSVGSILAVIRARTRAFELEELLDDVKRIRERGVFRAPDPNPHRPRDPHQARPSDLPPGRRSGLPPIR